MIAIRKRTNIYDDMATEEIINAALEDNDKTVADLLSQGVDINTAFQGFTVLHIACMHGNRPLVNYLLQHGETVRPIDFTIRTTERNLLPWQLAFENHHYDVAQLVARASRKASDLPQPRF